MVAIWSILVVLFSNLLVCAVAALAMWGLWLVTKSIRSNRSFNNLMCRVILALISFAALWLAYIIINFIMVTIVPPASVLESGVLVLVLIGVFNLIGAIVVPIVAVVWALFILFYVAVDRCPNCYYTEPAVISKVVQNVIVKTTKTTVYSDGTEDHDVSYQNEDEIDYTMKCPECGCVWKDQGLRINR